MTLFELWVAKLLYVLDFINFSPWANVPAGQQPLGLIPVGNEDGPIFRPPNGPKDFECRYPDMSGWRECTTQQNRGCWLRGPNGEEFNILTDYEKRAPQGITRKYSLDASEMILHPDGFINRGGKVFNKQYPGPWIQACWGDTIEINVTNSLPYNGTTVHWHGIRQNGTLDMDGVNGVTQCPIATNHSFTYKFKAVQYGSTWYHSHYSLQYPDGLLGPLTIFGPSSANYDDAIDPILMTDWIHRSAFEVFYKEMLPGGPPKLTSMLMNGRGNYNCTEKEVAAGNCTDPPEKYSMTFKEGRKYLLRLINTSVDSTWIFSIDNHTIQVISSDFVPIHPYQTDSVLVGIGQRYHVIVEATHPLPDDDYWIRMVPADDCNGFPDDFEPSTNIGILRYNKSSKADPTTHRQDYPTACSDEPYDKLVPMVPWKVEAPSNEQAPSTFQVGRSPKSVRTPWGNISRWEIAGEPLWLNFSNPTILNVAQNYNWMTDPNLASLAVIDESKVTSPESWIYLIITATSYPFGIPSRSFLPVAHPIHLHGHDFAILAQSSTPYWDGLVKMKFDNPPRRDVALLPLGGYLVIAFKADNPGSWLLHCHIAWHASSGLALQIMEREKDIKKTISSESWEETLQVCRHWDDWYANPKNHFNPKGEFQDDSGI